jgi:hypothetical protein
VNELAAPFEMTLPGISKHLKVPERAGLISRTRHAQFRPCHLEREALDAAMSWIEENRRIWAQRFDKLDAHLRDIQQPPPPGGSAPPGADRNGQPHRNGENTTMSAMPDAQLRVLEGQTHDMSPAVLGPVLVEFFAS